MGFLFWILNNSFSSLYKTSSGFKRDPSGPSGVISIHKQITSDAENNVPIEIQLSIQQIDSRINSAVEITTTQTVCCVRLIISWEFFWWITCT